MSQRTVRCDLPGKNRTWVLPDGSVLTDTATLDRLRKLAIPPAWKAVEVNLDPSALLVVVGLDSKDRKQYRYSGRHVQRQADAKFARANRLAKALPKLIARVESDVARDRSDEAVVVGLILKTAMRVGGEKDRQADVRAFGATTLQARHVAVNGDTVRFDFIAKKGAIWQGEFEDAALASALTRRLDRKPAEAPIFDTNAAKVNQYLSRFGTFTAKDIRTVRGTMLAREAMARESFPETKAAAKRLVKRVAEAVAASLKNTVAIAKKAYINPAVWRLLEERFEFSVIAARR